MGDMESDNETPANPGLYVGPVRRPLNADSEFFDAGNINRALLCKINVFAIISGGGDVMDFDHQQQSYECMVHNCFSTFSSLRRHEAHYETSHRNRCFTCGRSFPTHRLLDLHLSETHDSFFKAMAERRPMYACLVEGCAEVFQSPGKRHTHLVDSHRYPESFDFSRPSYSRKKTSTKIPKGDRAKGENRQLKAAGNRLKVKSFTKAAECAVKSGPEPALATSRAAFQSSDRRSRQQQTTSAPPKPAPPLLGAVAVEPRACKFWRTAAGCRAGSVCKFRHATASPDGARGGGGGDALKGLEGETPPAEVRAASVSTAGAVVRGAGGRWRPSSGAASGAGAGLSGFVLNSTGVGVALGERMEEDGGVDELISAMSKLMVPRHLRVGSSVRRGDPIG